MPGVIYIEAMAQLLGWLICYSHDFVLHPILSILEDARVRADLGPGFTAHIHAEIVSTSKTDSLGKATVMVEGRRIASVDRIIFSHFDGPDPELFSKRFDYFTRNMKIGLPGA